MLGKFWPPHSGDRGGLMTHRVRIRRALAGEASRMRFAHGVDLKRPSPVPLLENRGMERLPRGPVSPH